MQTIPKIVLFFIPMICLLFCVLPLTAYAIKYAVINAGAKYGSSGKLFSFFSLFTITAISNPAVNAAAVLKNPNTRDTAPANLTSPPPIPFLVTAEDIKSIKMIPAKAIKDKINSFGYTEHHG